MLLNCGMYPCRAGGVDGGLIERAGVATSTDLTRPGELTLHLDGTPDVFAAPYWILALGDTNGVSSVSHTPNVSTRVILMVLGYAVFFDYSPQSATQVPSQACVLRLQLISDVVMALLFDFHAFRPRVTNHQRLQAIVCKTRLPIIPCPNSSPAVPPSAIYTLPARAIVFAERSVPVGDRFGPDPGILVCARA